MSYKVKYEGHVDGLITVRYEDFLAAMAEAHRTRLEAIETKVIERGSELVLATLPPVGDVVLFPALTTFLQKGPPKAALEVTVERPSMEVECE